MIILFLNKYINCDDVLNEELVIKPLPTGHLNAYFQFTTAWHMKSRENCKFIYIWLGVVMKWSIN